MKCPQCDRFYQFKIAGYADNWHNYCKIGDMFYPCSGDECNNKDKLIQWKKRTKDLNQRARR